MEVKNCRKCKKIFQSLGNNLCDAYIDAEEKDFEWYYTVLLKKKFVIYKYKTKKTKKKKGELSWI